MTGPHESAQGEDPALDPRLLDALGAAAAELTGFSREAIQAEAIRRAARELLAIWPSEELHSRIHMRDPLVSQSLRLAVSVGETYFFRQPEHFHFIAGTLAPEWVAHGVSRVRAWSAGCATGEEPYSVAACLQAALASAPHISIDVLGTDLLTRNLSVARSATYGAWSQRPSAPLLAPLLRVLEGPAGAPPLVRILDRVRAVVRFHEHNLLAPSRDGEPFDLILCRNVLVYFAPEAARQAIAHLADALAPGGVLMLGSMDLNVAPPELLREGQPESLIFRKPRDGARISSPGTRISSPGAAVPQAQRNSSPGFSRTSSLGAARAEAPVPIAPRSSAPGLRSLEAAPGAGSSAPGAPKPPSAPNVKSITLPEPIALHLRALAQIEAGELESAERSLRTLLAASPAYLPGMFERALLHLRRGEPAAATLLMREVHKRAAALRPDEAIAGPEPMEARFYVESAEAYLRGGRG